MRNIRAIRAVKDAQMTAILTNEPAKTNENIKTTEQVHFEQPQMLVIQPSFTVYPCCHCGQC